MSDREVFAPIDREQAFLLYATFAGDIEKTAHALSLRPSDVLRVVEEEHWLDRLKPIIDLKKSSKPGDLERAINRALNFAQAHRMRLLVERVLHKIVGMSNEELQAHLYTEHQPKNGAAYKKFSLRSLADLATALEKAQSMSYLALTDTVQDRTRRKEQDASGHSGAEMHEQIAAAMAAVGESQSPRAHLLDAQLTMAENARIESEKPEHPHDNDDH